MGFNPPEHTPYQWQDAPSTVTPLDSTHLEAAEDDLVVYIQQVAELLGLAATAVQTANYYLQPGDFALFDCSSSSLAGDLPSQPPDQTRIGAKLVATSGSNALTLNTASPDVFDAVGGSTSDTLVLPGQSVLLQYDAALSVWHKQANELPLAQLDARYGVEGAPPVTSVFGRTSAVVAQYGDYTAAEVENAADKSSTSPQVFAGEVQAPDINVAGLLGATAGTRLVGSTASGPPGSGTFDVGDFIVTQDGHIWICTTAGTPGSWVNAGTAAGVTAFNTRTGAVTPGNSDYVAVASPGLTGATAGGRLVGGTASGAPASGTFVTGDLAVDHTGRLWVCTTGGSPGTWVSVGSSGSGTPTAAAAAGSGATSVSVLSGSKDTAGVMQFTLGNTSGNLVTVTFSAALAATPLVTLTPYNANAASAPAAGGGTYYNPWYVAATSTTAFTVGMPMKAADVVIQLGWSIHLEQ